ncbi:hypothetical protein [Bythopirellula goksoeyrii]|uniref:PEP-CTERM protein-sorting domain-containing protein n=1 Tax=Bythopirellula goksoeyrii TaxID=1400387 RepID=A0A5B9QMG1_9BACT|nr:hypothetical protein [Bythopirellula goksoeyrii]QEG35311.1 hypothetical protein Pr1d_26070 [Bythopirellula goksoeyrii]
MKTTSRSFFSSLLALALLFATAVVSDAAPINYGDFSGTSVMYLDVTETANSPGDDEPLYGPPTISGNKLDFDPSGFAATAVPGTPDVTDGQLNFTLMAAPGATLKTINISEGGDFTLFGSGTTSTQVGYGIALGSVVVTEINGSAIAPVALNGASAFGSKNLVADGPVIGASWGLTLSYDVDAALTAANLPLGATKLEIAINDTLLAISEPSSVAFIAKKDFMIDTTIPEPTSMALALLSMVALASSRRR